MNEIILSVPVFIVKEENSFVAYCPALELSSYGDSSEDAKDGFEDAVKIFIDEALKRGTLEKMLLNFGWTLRKKPQPLYEPNVAAMNDAFKSFANSETKDYYNKQIAIPA